jgi:hypothetical protein
MGQSGVDQPLSHIRGGIQTPYPRHQQAIPLTDRLQVDARAAGQLTPQPFLRVAFQSRVEAKATENDPVDTIAITDQQVVATLNLKDFSGRGRRSGPENDAGDQKQCDRQASDGGGLGQGDAQSLLPQMGQ